MNAAVRGAVHDSGVPSCARRRAALVELGRSKMVARQVPAGQRGVRQRLRQTAIETLSTLGSEIPFYGENVGNLSDSFSIVWSTLRSTLWRTESRSIGKHQAVWMARLTANEAREPES